MTLSWRLVDGELCFGVRLGRCFDCLGCDSLEHHIPPAEQLYLMAHLLKRGPKRVTCLLDSELLDCLSSWILNKQHYDVYMLQHEIMLTSEVITKK